MLFTPTQDQEKALEQLLVWQRKPSKQYITLGGYAGTGKTTLLGVWRRQLNEINPNLKVAFCSFTGKASQVLQASLKKQKALFDKDRVSTIHSLIYEAIDDSKGRVIGWKKRSALECDLIVIDEASMVSKNIWLDILSFQKQVLAVGDHGQLPPITETFSLMQNPEIRLEQIHRQAADSPIIQISQLVREHGFIPVGKYSKNVKKISRSDPDINSIIQSLMESWNEDTLFLVGTNWTRVKFNQQIRTMKELNSLQPDYGDRVICLKNNWEEGIYNGMLGRIENIKPEVDAKGTHHWYQATVKLDDNQLFNGKVSKYQFNSPTTISDVDGLLWYEIGDLFDFGYALTVHKAQGSQAPRVIVFEERNKYMDEEQWRRWLYTAVTRAEKELIVIGD